MAQLKITSKLEGLSPSEMAETAKRYPYKDEGPQLDGDGYVSGQLPLNRRILLTPDDKVWSVGDRQTAWSDPRTAGIASTWQKRHAIEQRKAREGWKGDIRAKRDGTDGPEYDRFMLSLSKVEAAELGEDGVNKVFQEFIDAVRRSPFGGNRMLEIEPIHTDTDHIHIHVNAHRMGYDLETKQISKTIWQPEIHTKEAERIANAIPGLESLEYVAPGSAGSRASDEARQAAANAIRAAGGVPSPDMTGEGRLAVRQVLPPAEGSRISEAMTEVERRMAKREQEQLEDAELLARIQHAASAMQEADKLRVDLAELRTDRDMTAAALEQVKEALASEESKVIQLTSDVSETSEKLVAEQAKTESMGLEIQDLAAQVLEIRNALAAETQARQVIENDLAEERRTFVERARAWAEENMMAPIRTELQEARDTLAKAQQTIVDQAKAIAAIPGQIAEAVTAAEAKMEARMTAMVEAAVKATRDALAAPFQAAGEAIRSKSDADKEAAFNTLIAQGKPWESLSKAEQRMALRHFNEVTDRLLKEAEETGKQPNYMPESPRELYEVELPEKAVEPAKTVQAQETPVKPEPSQAAPKGKERPFYAVPPSEWSESQRAAAEANLKARAEKEPEKFSGLTLEYFGEAIHDKYKSDQAAKSVKSRKPKP